MCSADVPEGVCGAPGGQGWRQVVLQALHQHTAPSQGRHAHEGQNGTWLRK